MIWTSNFAEGCLWWSARCILENSERRGCWRALQRPHSQPYWSNTIFCHQLLCIWHLEESIQKNLQKGEDWQHWNPFDRICSWCYFKQCYLPSWSGPQAHASGSPEWKANIQKCDSCTCKHSWARRGSRVVQRVGT